MCILSPRPTSQSLQRRGKGGGGGRGSFVGLPTCLGYCILMTLLTLSAKCRRKEGENKLKIVCLYTCFGLSVAEVASQQHRTFSEACLC